MRDAVRAGRVKTLKTKIVEAWNVTGAANTAYSTVFALAPNASSEATSITALFDDMKLDAVTLHVTLNGQGDGAGNGEVADSDAVFAFDPTTSTALGSLVNGLETDQNSGPLDVSPTVWANQTANGIVAAAKYWGAPLPVTKTGWWKFHWKIPKGTALNPGTSAEIVGGSWFSTQDANVVCGYIKPYVQAMGTHIVANIDAYVVYHVTLRSRH